MNKQIHGNQIYNIWSQILSKEGIYIIVFRVNDYINLIINKNEFIIDKGYIIYIGSAGNGLNNRLRRHLTKNKKLRWHIDYVTNNKSVEPSIIYYKEGLYGVKIEDELSSLFYSKFLKIDNLGATDSKMPHMYYSNNIKEILKIIYKLDGSIIIFPSIFDYF
ncbi:hypothetical protein Calag_0782 [Caldisphaera lagunensis DSM 15908]|uniref:GIY-YIG domain-containing protein n=1 Tax=Caldisphaera lagunensis (strain DSM 15908 / JCM 11604 / ANMR 0165 / IC-154) TaxID=1056495 RepID=L0AAS3_CALLD|nr:DUF123 domain-containing protein [Caldisphaera lagunensis]AFZ70524.1 hypothetical protein Calag_0782 [Caldisphaera lagunensis DSM 15908]